MQNIRIISCLLFTAALLVLPHQVKAETSEITTSADSFVNDGYPANNYTAATLTASLDSVIRWALVRFDLGTLPEKAQIDSAILKLYQFEASGDDSAAVKVSRVLGEWTENEVTWNNRPDYDTGGIGANLDKTTGWKTWDATDTVRGWKNSDYSNYGFAVSGDAGSFARTFHSKEHWGNSPLLVINYHLPELTATPTNEPTAAPSPSPSLTPTSTPKPILSPTETPEPSPTPETDENLTNEDATPEAEKTATSSAAQNRLPFILIGLGLLLVLVSGGYVLYLRQKKRKKTSDISISS